MKDRDFSPTDPPSKSQRKRESTALQDLGAELVRLPAESLLQLDLPERLHDAVLEAKRITSHGAMRRQMQFIGKVMRNVDAAPIAEQLAVMRNDSDRATAELHALERWRERLLDDDDALTEWLERHPGGDAQQLRQLIRKARLETTEGKPPRSRRALFRLLRQQRSAAAGVAAETDPEDDFQIDE